MKIKAYAAKNAKDKLENYEYDPKALSAFDIEVDITHCGICHSDVHLIDNDWQMSGYPLVPGHEIIGKVKELGSHVKNFKKGDRVGIGWQRSACLECATCIKGDENLCKKNEATCAGNHGGFADRIRSDSRFSFKIPEKLASENAAPLLCGGITVFSPLRLWVKPQMKVGVIGIGGLGHLAVQFARAFGCEVTAFSSTDAKKEEAMKFGAHNFVSSTDNKAWEKLQGHYDFIISTVNVNLDWNSYLGLLGPDGRLCFVGASDKPLDLQVFPLLVGRKTVCGSPIGGRTLINEMLEFAARHNIVAKTEVVEMSKVNEAIQKVRDNKARYRMVLRNE